MLDIYIFSVYIEHIMQGDKTMNGQFEIRVWDAYDAKDYVSVAHMPTHDSLDAAITVGTETFGSFGKMFHIFHGDNRIAFVEFGYGTHMTTKCEWIAYPRVKDTSGKFVPYTMVAK